jgi:hypothetical protein
MAIITIPRVLVEKLGNDGSDALAEVIKEVERDAHKELATKADIKELEGKLKELEGKLKLYFIILIFTIIFLSPHAIDLIAKLFGVVK